MKYNTNINNYVYSEVSTSETLTEQTSDAEKIITTSESATVQPPVSTQPYETSVHGKEVHTQKQTQTQKEVQGDLEITRKTTVTETMEQEHKGTTKERIVVGAVVS